MKKTTLFLLTGVLIAGIGNVAHAQRDRPDRNERRGNFRDQMEAMSPQQRVQFLENMFDERLKTANPEQREQMLNMRAQVEKRIKDAGIDLNDPNAFQKMQQSGIFNGLGGQGGGERGGGAAANAMRAMMEASGITDFDVQDAVIGYVAEQNKARATLFQLAQVAANALQAPVAVNSNTGEEPDIEAADAKVATTFSDYETAVKAENERQEKALQILDAKINYTGTPRIKAFLALVGILNNDVLAIGGPAAVFAPSQDLSMAPMGTNGRTRDEQMQGRDVRGAEMGRE